MIRIQLDLIAQDDGSPADQASISRAVDEAVDELAAKFGNLSIVKWSVAPLPLVDTRSIEAATQEVTT